MRLEVFFNEFKYKGQKGSVLYSDTGFEISKGEKIALVGANGSGKSTLINLLSGIVKKRGKGVIKNSFNKKVLVSNALGLHHDLSLLDNYRLFSKIFRRKVFHHYFDLSEFDNILFKNLSAGTQIKSLFNVYLNIREESLILMDEPTEFLDEKSKSHVLKICQDNKFTGIIASHDLDFLYQFCTHKLEIKDKKFIKVEV